MSRLSRAGDTAPRVRVHTLDGSYLELASVEADEVVDIMDMLRGDGDGDGNDALLSFDLDDGRAQVHIPRAAIARVDVDWDLGWIARTRARLRVAWDRLV